jgi:hypothetical protein
MNGGVRKICSFGGAHVHTNIRDAKAGCRDLNPLLGINKYLPLPLACMKVNNQLTPQGTVISLAQVALQYFAIDVIAIRPIRSAQVLLDGNERGSLHVY